MFLVHNKIVSQKTKAELMALVFLFISAEKFITFPIVKTSLNSNN